MVSSEKDHPAALQTGPVHVFFLNPSLIPGTPKYFSLGREAKVFFLLGLSGVISCHTGYVGTRFDGSNSAFQGESPNPDVPSQAQKSLLAHHPHAPCWPPADQGGQIQVQSIPGEHPEDTGTSAAPGKLASVPCTTAAPLERRNHRAPQCKAAASATGSPTVQTAFRINYPSRPLWARGKISCFLLQPHKKG